MTTNMKKLSNYFLVVFSLISTSSFLVNAKKPSALFIFGDSIFDAGNNNYINTFIKGNFFPYGKTFFKNSTGRLTDGRIIPDFISQYAKLPFIQPYLQPGFHNYTYGVNFASSGAGVLPETRQGLVISLDTQLSYFDNVTKQLKQELGGEEELKAFLSSAVYLFSVGANDYFEAFEKINSTVFNSQHSLEEYVRTVIGNFSNDIKEIYNKGGRKFGFMNLWSLGCVPYFRARKADQGKHGCVEELQYAVKLHSKALSHTLQNLEASHLDGFKYSILDFLTAFSERSDNPSKYGFNEAKIACCGSGPFRGYFTCGSENYELCDDPSKNIYFDNIHPGESLYKQLAELFWTGNLGMARPYNLKQLFENHNH